MLDGLLKAAIADAMNRARNKQNILLIGCDDVKEDGSGHNVGCVTGDPVAIAYAMTRLFEKEPLIYATFRAAVHAFEECQKRETNN